MMVSTVKGCPRGGVCACSVCFDRENARGLLGESPCSPLGDCDQAVMKLRTAREIVRQVLSGLCRLCVGCAHRVWKGLTSWPRHFGQVLVLSLHRTFLLVPALPCSTLLGRVILPRMLFRSAKRVAVTAVFTVPCPSSSVARQSPVKSQEEKREALCRWCFLNTAGCQRQILGG